MKFEKYLLLPTSSFIQTAKSFRKPTTYHSHKPLFQKHLRRFTSKEKNAETRFYYYEVRYLDPKTSRWLSVDPAMHQGDYIPSAPIDDEARKRNGNLPNGGIYNYINMHLYNYSNNNPVKYKDPDGETPRYAPVENAVNFDFGKDYMALAEANFKEGHYGLAAIMTLDAVCEAGYNTLAAYGGASAIGAAGSVIASLTAPPVVQQTTQKMQQVASTVTQRAQPVFRALKEKYFRHNFQQFTGQTGKGMEAHHVLPKASRFTLFFENAKLNIHDPKFGVWVNPTAHRHWSSSYNKRWDSFIKENPNATAQQILDFAKSIANEFGYKVNF